MTAKAMSAFLGYPGSKVSRMAGDPDGKGIVNDSIAIYRKATADAGVSLLMHFSGVWDNVACQDHPEWAARAARQGDVRHRVPPARSAPTSPSA